MRIDQSLPFAFPDDHAFAVGIANSTQKLRKGIRDLGRSAFNTRVHGDSSRRLAVFDYDLSVNSTPRSAGSGTHVYMTEGRLFVRERKVPRRPFFAPFRPISEARFLGKETSVSGI